MNKFILSIFLFLSIFSSVQSFASQGELTESELIAQFLDGLKGYATTLGHSYEPVRESDLEDIEELSRDKILVRTDRLMKKAAKAEQLQYLITKSLLGVHKDLESSLQRMTHKISSLEEERDSFREILLTLQEAEDSEILDIEPEDLSNLTVFQIRVFDPTIKLRASNLRKNLIAYFEKSHPLETDPEIMIQWLETLTVGELLVIFNDYLQQEPSVTNLKFHTFFRKIGVPYEIHAKMIHTYKYGYLWDMTIAHLERLFSTELYKKIEIFLLETAVSRYGTPLQTHDLWFEGQIQKHLTNILSHPKCYLVFTKTDRLNIRLFLKALENDGKRLTSKQIFEAIPRIGNPPN